MTPRPSSRPKLRLATDRLCTAAAFAVVLGIVLGAGTGEGSSVADRGGGSRLAAVLSIQDGP